MTVAFAGRAPSTFEIKSANLPLVALLLKSANLALLETELTQRFSETPNFFAHDPLVIDLSLLPPDAAELDFGRLLSLLRSHRMAPIAFKGSGERQAAAARAAGLIAAPDTEMHHRSAARSAAADGDAPVAAPAAANTVQGALVVQRQVRSGQQIYAKGRDLVVLATVNAGAEVIADGHVHVYGCLRGKAIAGARGDTEARIFAMSLEAELIAIAGTYRTSETPLPPDVRAQPTQIRLVGEKLLMEPLKN